MNRGTPPVIGPVSIALLADRARRLVAPGGRRILGITGAPGAGKSTVAAAIVARLDGLAVCAPMDGFHLANAELARLGRRDRKGAPDTFDAAGYVALLRRLKEADEETVFAPEFRRDLEEPIAGAIAIGSRVPLVVTEGNYLLLDRGPWAAVRGLVDEIWYLDPDDERRVERLIERHVRFGKSTTEARAWVMRSDERNSTVIFGSLHRADLIVRGWPSL